MFFYPAVNGHHSSDGLRAGDRPVGDGPGSSPTWHGAALHSDRTVSHGAAPAPAGGRANLIVTHTPARPLTVSDRDRDPGRGSGWRQPPSQRLAPGSGTGLGGGRAAVIVPLALAVTE